jgi:omega-hydroxy-beta-dihydromenaquinone-9 sulfotransferase
VSLFWWKIHLRTAAAAWRVFGLDRRTLIYAARRPMAMGLARLALALDNVCYPAYRSVAVRKPVFILGHPRSGTTFLQLLLTQTAEFCAFAAWEIFVPSLTARALVRRAMARRIAEGRTTFFPAEMGHQVALDQIEEDELLLIYTSNTELVSTISPLAFGDWDFSELVYADAQPEPLRRRTMAFLRGCYQRQIYVTGKPQVVGKLTYSAMRLRSLLAEFPDARIVYIVRSPFETIPSFFSLERNLFAHMWGEVSIPRDVMERYYRRRYASSVAYYRYVEDLMDSGALPPTQFMAVSYDELRRNLVTTVDRIASFAGLQLSPELRERIAKQEREQKTYQRRHANLGLEEFGLTEERVRADFAYVFDKYGFER